MEPPILISAKVHRRFILGKQGLWPGRRWTGNNGIKKALYTIESVQMDPVTIIAPSHDLVLWGRVREYRSEDLHTLLYDERQFFDYGGGLMIYPIEELPYWRVMMERYKSEKRWADFAQANPVLLDRVRQAIRSEGPLRKRDFSGQAVQNYRANKDSGVALYYLWLTGELMSHSRQGKERVYDVFENIAPAHLQWSAAESEAIEFFTQKAISQLGLVNGRDVRRVLRSAHGHPISAKDSKLKLSELVEAGRLRSIRLEGHRELFYALSSDVVFLEKLTDGVIPLEWQPIQSTTSEEVVFLSPLEYVSARGRAKELFDFEYIWEIYKPETKRQFGPYTMPILYGDRLVARMDAKYERVNQILTLNGFWTEEWFVPDESFVDAFANGLLCLAEFLGAMHIETAALRPSLLNKQVADFLKSRGVN